MKGSCSSLLNYSELVGDTHPFILVLTKMNYPWDIILVALTSGNVDGYLPRPHDAPVPRICIRICVCRHAALHEGQINPLGSGVVDTRYPNILPALLKQIFTRRRGNVYADNRRQDKA